ncbi:glycosyltransferase family 9 protein [uncultured Pseudoalteromonas sp.]|uniref:glycosyltransferase family 9 protein n=1 Tax=uncultured Pseudoalteromonas sp. TaxID=114053 RepID=UPI0025CF7351|nr:glycosyltransferase family 9 protein [uncultured Pseudoalteromonas sp.]|tara:strand:+ start:11227 stop:12231 length:1005 start_codon:yes stop_codon:yes gene_type:complete
MQKKIIDAKSIKGNILVILPKFIGDAINCSPAIELLKSLYPRKRIFVIARPHLVPILERDKSLSIISDDRFKSSHSISLLGFANTLKKKDIELAFILRNSLSEALLCFLAKVKYRIGYAQNGRSPFLSHKFKLNKNHHYLYRYCRLITQTHELMLKEMPSTSLHFQDSLLIEKTSNSINVGLYFGGKNKKNRHYPNDLAATAIEKIAANNTNIHFILIGDPTEKKDSELLIEELNNPKIKIRNLVGETSIVEMLDLIGSLNLLVTIDSGPMHIAAAAGIPFVAIVGLGTSPWSTVAPKQKNYIPLVANGYQLDEKDIIRDITPNDICSAVSKLI